MDYVLLSLCLVSLINLTTSHQNYHDDFFHNTDSDEYYDSSEEQTDALDEAKQKDDIGNTKTEDITSIRPAARYEVTENVIDIPNPVIYKAPVFTNFTIPRPLNNATVPKKIIENNQSKKNTVEDEINNLKKYVDVIHDVVNKNNKQSRDDFEKFPHVASSIKDYIYGVKKGIVSGFNSILGSGFIEDDDDDDKARSPSSFFSNLHKKTSDAAYKIHKAVFGYKDFEY